MSSNPVSHKTVQRDPPRQWIGIVLVYLSIPLALLACGGDFGWWQAWIYSLLIVAAGIGGHIWAEQRHPGLMAERQNIENIQSAKAWDKVLAPLMADQPDLSGPTIMGDFGRFDRSVAAIGA